MNISNRRIAVKILLLIFTITLTIICIKQLIPKSKAEEETVVGSNTGYGMVTVTYHSNYLAGTAANGGKATEQTYTITTPIYLNSKGEYCISLGEYKFAEKQISSDGIKNPSTDASAIDTGFRGYTLEQNPTGMRDTNGFWVGKTTGSNGPDDIPDSAMANTTDGVKRIFNDWEDGIYQQGDELVLNSTNLSGYDNIEYSINYDANRNSGTGTMGDTRNTYSIDVYAQWVKANIIYVASESTSAKVTSLKSTFGVANITTSKVKTTISEAITAVNKKGNSYYHNYIVVTDYSANSSMGYTANSVEETNGNGFTITSKYFGYDSYGRLYFTGDDFRLYEDWRIRDIDIYSLKIGDMAVNNVYTQGYSFIMEYGIRCFQGETASAAAKMKLQEQYIIQIHQKLQKEY